MIDFETETKRDFGQNDDEKEIIIPGLKEDPEQGCHDGYLAMSQ